MDGRMSRLFIFSAIFIAINGQFEWQTRDAFDVIRQKLDAINSDNCQVVDKNDLFLPMDTVTHIPDLSWLGVDPVFPNRSSLLQIHNLALSRAFYFSYILQKATDLDEPGFMYYFLSTIADVAANRFINSSAVYYAPNMAFTPSYKGFYNKTMPLFAPRAFRVDDFNDPYHLQGTSTLNTIEATDLGAIPLNSRSLNYTHDVFTINEWYKKWLPDLSKRHDSKRTYTVHISHANNTNETFVWHGPPAAYDKDKPVAWFRPYFDCDRSNKWIMGGVVPIADIYPRHTGWRHIELPLYVAAVVMELDFDRLDINQCPISKGNPGPNYFADTARCKKKTTECEPIHGYGFRRGGYQCRCKPGNRLPKTVRTPYLGEIVERATQMEYKKGFGCEKIGYIGVRTQRKNRMSAYDRMRHLGIIKTVTGLSGNQNTSIRLDPEYVTTLVKKEITEANCNEIKRTMPEKLVLRGDVSFGKEDRFENQARMAMRLANFISAFLQVINPEEVFAEFRVPDRSLTADQIIGEVVSVVIGDLDILGCGVAFDRNKFPNYTLFAPYAYRIERKTDTYFVDDLSRRRERADDFYLYQNSFDILKTRWSSNIDDLQTYTSKVNIRFNSSGLSSIHYDVYPLQYKAAEMKHGYWSSPFFDCSGFHKKWILSYSVPFFGYDKIKSNLEFKGVVMVSMPLEKLDINQCSSEGEMYNAFKNTHKCDRHSSRCVPILGRRFETGGYKCECLQGFEYPLNDDITYFDGQVVESEYVHMLNDEPSRFDTLKCRIAASTHLQSNSFTVLLLTLIFLVLHRF
ncbi:uncharacterized protein B4U80_10938 [Leptotrombidium deliense]|uniref:GPR158/179 extracellular domain-containing protein n=1 Tax=Leptotrombidium deliense TaxID=299467 RepID=A0A443SNH9_9ACAR|nr:uncharacterized protein B4U80_10938 [Leptotrombidium deliense]